MITTTVDNDEHAPHWGYQSTRQTSNRNDVPSGDLRAGFGKPHFLKVKKHRTK